MRAAGTSTVGSRSWVDIDEDRLAQNYRIVREAAGTEVLAVVKANAYGHGLERCAVALARAGAKWLGVADAAEGVRVRKALEAAGIPDAGPSTAAAVRPSLGMTDSSTGREASLGMTDSSTGREASLGMTASSPGREASLGMTELWEGPQILVMCGVTRDEVGAVVKHGLTPVVWTMEQVESLAQAEGQRQIQGSFAPLRMTGHGSRRTVPLHVEIDTGMGRQGVRPGAELEELLRASADAGLMLDGVCTHFSSAEVAGSERTREQKRRFEAAVAQLKEMGLKPRWVHAGNSSSVDVGEGAAWLEDVARSVGERAMMRSGIALYGYVLPAVGTESKIRAKLKPVMTWKTRVLDVRDVPAGEAIGYSATFTAKQAVRVALLPVGYSDGLRRELGGSNDGTNERAGGWVMVRGSDGEMRRAPIVGRVSMNLATVDVTGIDGVSVGDEVELLGDGITADDHARTVGTISYEILCGVKGRLLD